MHFSRGDMLSNTNRPLHPQTLWENWVRMHVKCLFHLKNQKALNDFMDFQNQCKTFIFTLTLDWLTIVVCDNIREEERQAKADVSTTFSSQPPPTLYLMGGAGWKYHPLFPLPPFPVASQRFCYSHWPTVAVRSAIFPFLFFPHFFCNSTLIGEQAGGWGSFRALFTHTTAGKDRFRKKKKLKCLPLHLLVTYILSLHNLDE